ncbi:MAG: DUF1007 family protein [Spirochaetales bacterium]|nr:DUF1007 family protein [Spirochaetales bacterium]
MSVTNKMKRFIILLFAIVLPVSLSAHPHMSINAYAHYYFDQSGFMGFYIQWIFDPLFSSQIVYECDTDNDLSFSDKELEQVEKYYFSRLDDYNFYTELRIEDRVEPLGIPVNFSAEIDTDDDNVVIFTFYVPVNRPYKSGGTRITVDFTDHTNYTAFICPQRALSVYGDANKISDIVINRLGTISFTYQ